MTTALHLPPQLRKPDSNRFPINTTIHVTPPDLITAAGHGNRLSWGYRGAIQYDVWIMSLNNPAVPVRNERVNTPEYELAAELPDGAYRVWTRSYPVLGAPSAWSTPFDFVKGMSPVVHTVPVTSEQQKPLIKWTGPTDVVSYEFWVDNRDKKVRVLHVSGLKAASLQIEQSLEPAVYAAWVRGTRANGTVTNSVAIDGIRSFGVPGHYHARDRRSIFGPAPNVSMAGDRGQPLTTFRSRQLGQLASFIAPTT